MHNKCIAQKQNHQWCSNTREKEGKRSKNYVTPFKNLGKLYHIVRVLEHSNEAIRLAHVSQHCCSALVVLKINNLVQLDLFLTPQSFIFNIL